MQSVQRCLTLVLVSATSLFCKAQDKIYTSTDIRDGQVKDITVDKVKFLNPLNPGPLYSLSRSTVLVVFNSIGQFLVLCKLDPQNASHQERVHAFLTGYANGASLSPGSDWVITSGGTCISCRYEREDDNQLFFSTTQGEQQMQKSAVIAAIFKSGQHHLYAHIDNAIPVLAHIQDSLMKKAPEATAATSAVAPVATAPVAVAAAEPPAPIPSRPAAPPAPSPSRPAAAPPAASATPSGKISDEPDGATFSQYEQRALQKTNELSAYIKVLCDKSVGYEEADKAIDQAVSLFINEDATVEVSTLGTEDVHHYKIRDYLKKLKLLKYGKVEIKWTNIQYVSKLKKGKDGNYYGIVSFEQSFTGYIENHVAYSDVSTKNVEVELKTYARNSEGKTTMAWDVLLSNIGVVSTKL